MKRFHTQPSEFFNLDNETRDLIFDRELEIVKKEYEEMEALKNKNKK